MTLDPTKAKVYKSVSELPGLTGELTGLEILPLTVSGRSFKRPVIDLYGAGWFATLRGKLADFIAPDATHADQTDYAALAADSEAVNGITFETGRGLDRWEEVEIVAGGAWVIPSGSFMIYAWNADSIASLILEADDGRTPGSWTLRAPFPSGLVLSDGVSQRIRNRSAGKLGLTFRVLAHA